MLITLWVYKKVFRAVVRTGSMGAFAPVNFEQRVLSTCPEKKISMKAMKTINKLMQKSRREEITTLKNLAHVL